VGRVQVQKAQHAQAGMLGALPVAGRAAPTRLTTQELQQRTSGIPCPCSAWRWHADRSLRQAQRIGGGRWAGSLGEATAAALLLLLLLLSRGCCHVAAVLSG